MWRWCFTYIYLLRFLFMYEYECMFCLSMLNVLCVQCALFYFDIIENKDPLYQSNKSHTIQEWQRQLKKNNKSQTWKKLLRMKYFKRDTKKTFNERKKNNNNEILFEYSWVMLRHTIIAHSIYFEEHFSISIQIQKKLLRLWTKKKNPIFSRWFKRIIQKK